MDYPKIALSRTQAHIGFAVRGAVVLLHLHLKIDNEQLATSVRGKLRLLVALGRLLQMR